MFLEKAKDFKRYLLNLAYYGLNGFDFLDVPEESFQNEDFVNIYYNLADIYSEEEIYFDENEFDVNKFNEFNELFRSCISECLKELEA